MKVDDFIQKHGECRDSGHRKFRERTGEICTCKKFIPVALISELLPPGSVVVDKDDLEKLVRFCKSKHMFAEEVSPLGRIQKALSGGE